jgi:hypothetical protein
MIPKFTDVASSYLKLGDTPEAGELLYLAFTWWASRQARGRINHDAHLAGALAGVVFVALADPQVLSRAVSRLVG